MNNDRVEKTIELRAPRHRVWQAINNPKDFGTWFGLGEPLTLEGDFVPGARVMGVWNVGGREMRELFFTVEEVVPDTLLAFRWNPYEIPAGDDPANHPTTRIELRLEDCAIGTRLVVSEAGFAALPADKQNKREQNAGGWEIQVQAIACHVLGGVEAAVEQHIARAPADVFRAITDPAQLARYFADATGPLANGAKVEWRWGDQRAEIECGQFADDATIGFAWNGAGTRTKVTLSVFADDAGTRLSIHEAPFPLTDDGARKAVAQTALWTRFAVGLAAHLEHGLGLRHGA